MSLFVLYFGTDIAYDDVAHTILFGPRYKGLLDDIFKGVNFPTISACICTYQHSTRASLLSCSAACVLPRCLTLDVQTLTGTPKHTAMASSRPWKWRCLT